ncbi:hypothetical protein, partial [Anaerotignum sp.]|uniref:hypothetical protein n=1 Tax=Anaerotignum sp. TaxID=2039241 RepID=UPI0028A2D2EF
MTTEVIKKSPYVYKVESLNWYAVKVNFTVKKAENEKVLLFMIQKDLRKRGNNMFVVDKEKNQALPLCKKTFSELNFTERNHLQEWIDQDTSILGENLLIIQKEFNGFSDTLERLDLLALDESGRLVVIENKLDDSGKDVV